MDIAVIAARGGSTRIKHKNIRPFCGKPIIEYAIAAALSSKLFAHVVVSTDSEDIARVAKEAGALIPFVRPPALADNAVPLADVIYHATDWMLQNCGTIRFVCALYANSPLIRVSDLRRGLLNIQDNDADAAIAVARFRSPIHRALQITAGDRLRMLWPEFEMTHSTDVPTMYHHAAHFIWLKVERFMISRRIFTDNSVPVIIPGYLGNDIDDEEDWVTTEVLYDVCKRNGLLN